MMDLTPLIKIVIEQAPNFIFAGVGLWLMHRISMRQADVIEKVVDALLEMAERNSHLAANGTTSGSIKN